MKVIDTHFEEDSTALIELLKASITGEVILYKGAKCTVHIDPSFTADDIELLEGQNPNCLVNAANTVSRNLALEKGFFHSKKYQFKIIDATYEMVVYTMNDKRRIAWEMPVTMNIQSTNLQNSDKFSDAEWAKEHADSIVEKNNCTLL